MNLALINEFPSGAWEKLIPAECLVDREGILLSLCAGKRVLHLGAADSPFHKEKAPQGMLLHQRIDGVAAENTGIDLDAEAVDWLRDNHGIRNIITADASGIFPDIAAKEFDIVLCCDIIEHVSNIGGLLETCKVSMNASTELVITTINATSLKPAMRAMFGREAVHHEHICYFSFGTLCQLLIGHGLIPKRFGAFCYPAVTGFAKVTFELLAKRFPGTADGIIVVATLA